MKPETRSFYEAAVIRAVERVARSLDEALDLDTLAREAALSPFHFHRVFHGLVGETPLELHRRLRLERAAECLCAPERGDAAVAIVMFLFQALMFVPPGARAAKEGIAADMVAAIERSAPRLLSARDHQDTLLAAWAWHLLSWFPHPVAGLADDSIARLERAQPASLRLPIAFAATSTSDGRTRVTPVLEAMLAVDGEPRRVAAMVLAQVFGHPQRPEATREEVYAALLALSEGSRWQPWEDSPGREHGFYADLAICLVRAGYTRAAKTLPAVIHIVDVCSGDEMDSVLDAFLRGLYHSHPYEGDAALEKLDDVQRAALQALVARPRAWLPRPGFYQALSGLGIPTSRRGVAELFGVPSEFNEEITVKSIEDGVLVLDAKLSPAEITSRLKA